MGAHKNKRNGTSAPDVSVARRPFKGILLDLDNTLYDYAPCHVYALKKCHGFFTRTIRRVSFEKFQSLYLKGRETVKGHNRHTVGSRSRHLYFQVILENEYGKTDARNTLCLGDIYWESFLKRLVRRPWVLPFLKDVKKRGIKIVVVTNLESSIQYKKLLRLGIADFIDFIVTSEEAGREKPGSKIYKLALDKIGLTAEDVVMIGDDAKEDGAGAMAMGIQFILCG